MAPILKVRDSFSNKTFELKPVIYISHDGRLVISYESEPMDYRDLNEEIEDQISITCDRELIMNEPVVTLSDKMKKIKNINFAIELHLHQKFLESVFSEQPDFWLAKARILDHLKLEFPEFFEKSQTEASIEVCNYLVELLATLIDSDVHEASIQSDH